MIPPLYALNGVEIPSVLGKGLFATEETLWNSDASVVGSPVEIPGQHGELLTDDLPVFGAAKLAITAHAYADADQAQIEHAVRVFTALVSQPRLTLSRTVGSNVTSARVRLESLVRGGKFRWGRAATLTAAFAVPQVFLRESPSLSLVSSWTSDIPLLHLDRLDGSSGPIGDALIRIRGPLTAVAVTDLLSATGISWSGVLASGDWLYLSPRLCRAWIAEDYEAWEPTGTDVSGGLDWPAAGRLQLWPQVTALDVPTRITVSAVGAGRAAGTTLAIRAGRCYL